MIILTIDNRLLYSNTYYIHKNRTCEYLTMFDQTEKREYSSEVKYPPQLNLTTGQ